MEGLKLSEAELMIFIHPSQSRNVFQGICRELSSLLFQFVLFLPPIYFFFGFKF